jgi:hypothetical protein
VIAVALTGLLWCAGCSGTAQAPNAPTAAPCIARSGLGFAWPATMPLDLPLPRGATLTSTRILPSGFTVVQFTSPGTVPDSLLFAIAALQSAGYTVGRGIAGLGETNLPFTKGGMPGVVRLMAVNSCTTSWQIVA